MQKTRKKTEFEVKAPLRATRDGFGEGLLLAAQENKNVVALAADLMESTRIEAMRGEFPERCFEVGVAEQNLAALAAGLGISGKIPFIASYATFSPGRNWEQIRTTIAYNESNVKIAGHHAGLLTGPDGATHQALEDIALMRAIPKMTVIIPADATEAKKATLAAARLWGPVYLRLEREATEAVTSEKTPFVPGKACVLHQSSKPKCLIVGAGPILAEALAAARELEAKGIGSVVLNCHTVKPLDKETILFWAKKTGAVVTAEEHQIAGGLGGAVAELLAETIPVPVEFVGMRDSFGESGAPAELVEKFGLDAKHIFVAVKKAIQRAKK